MPEQTPMPAPTPQLASAMVLSKHRIEALADGLFAIVMTLLVLELKVPDLPSHATASEIFRGLTPMWRVMFSFVLTFFLASIFWMMQQSMLTATKMLDRAGAALHLVAMMFVALLPFSSAMMGRFVSNRLVMGLYFGNQFAIALFLCLAWFRERHIRNIVEMESAAEQKISERIVNMVAVMLGACIVASYEPNIAFVGVLAGLGFARIYRQLRKPAR